jgi:carbamoyl-phosphate synthase large subunit
MSGPEIGVDAYIDIFSRKTISMFTKRKISMRAGETDKSISFKDEKLFKLIVNFVDKIGFIGVIDIDIFEKKGEYFFSEVNPRFGGGYPHAYECGVNVPRMIICNCLGDTNKILKNEYEDGIHMMKYNEIVIKKISS